MIVNICGIPHKVIEIEDNFDLDVHFGQIDYKKCEIRINKSLSSDGKHEALCHEIIHGIFVHLGFNKFSQDEHLVQALGNAIFQSFDVRFQFEESETIKEAADDNKEN